MDPARRAIGQALVERADDVASSVLEIVWPAGRDHVDPDVVAAIMETDRIATRQIGRWLTDGQDITAAERQALGSLGGMVDRLALDDLVKAYFAWRDAMLRTVDDLVTHLDASADLQVEVARLISRNTDGSVVRMARRFERERELLRRQLEVQATHDALTGLPNRLLLFDRLGHALRAATRTEQRLAVLFVDLDGFKGVNDRLGHQAGDAVLVSVAQRLAAAVREADTVARLGGDEFVVLCEHLEDAEQPVRIAERIIDALDRPFELAGEEASISASVGIAEAGGCDDPGELLMRADLAMYAAKQDGPGGHRVSQPT